MARVRQGRRNGITSARGKNKNIMQTLQRVRKIACACAILAPVLGLAARAQELRGAWLARDSMATRAMLAAAMDSMAAANFNVVYVNVWSRGYPLWKSSVFQQYTGVLTDPGFSGRDILAEALAEGHRAGLEVECWFEYGFVGGWDGYYPGRSGKGPIFDAHPDWLARDRSGSDTFPSGAGGSYYWMAHTRPDVRQFLIDLVLEVVQQYDIDGIEFDRARYPKNDCGYDAHTRLLYRNEHSGQEPPDDPNDPSWIRWRADDLNRFVASLHRAVKAIRPEVTVSNAPVPYPDGYRDYCQDYPGWIGLGALDFVTPQVYQNTLADYIRRLDAQLAATTQRSKVYPGIKATDPVSPSDLVSMVRATRERGLPGMIFWYLVGLQSDFSLLKTEVFQQKNAIPYRDSGWPRAQLMLDETAAQVEKVGTWESVAGGWQGSSLTATGQGPAQIRYVFAPVRSAWYQIYAYTLPASGKTARARYLLHDRCDQETESVLNQQLPANDGWISLGFVYLDKDRSQPALVLDNSLVAAGEKLHADAVMLIESHLPPARQNMPYCLEKQSTALFRLADFNPQVRVGHAKLSLQQGGPPSGMAIFKSWTELTPAGARILVSAAGVPITSTLRKGAFVAELGDIAQTGFALSNLTDKPANISLELRSATGQVLPSGAGSVALSLAPGTQLARFLGELFSGAAAPREGTVRLSSDQPISGVSLRGFTNERGEFVMTTMPLFNLEADAPKSQPVLPQIADGGGYTTQFLLMNGGESPIAGQLKFFSASGDPLEVHVDGSLRSAIGYDLPAYGMKNWITGGKSASVRTGYALVIPTERQPAPATACVFSFRQSGGTRTEVGVPETTADRIFRTYVRQEEAGGVTEITGLAVANPGDTPASLRITLFSESGGEVIARGTRGLAARAHESRFLSEWIAGLPARFQGVLQLESDVPVAALGLLGLLNQRRDFLMSAVPAVLESTAGVKAFPHLAAGDGYSTEIILVGGPQSTGTALGRMEFLLSDGRTWAPRIR